MPSLFYVNNSPAGPQWIEHFDNTKWEIHSSYNYGTWNGSAWVSEEEPNEWIVSLHPINGWEVDFRPTKMKLTWTGGQNPTELVRLRDTNNNYIVAAPPFYEYSSGDEITINWNSYDIDLLYVASYNVQFTLTNIEFYG